MFESESIQNLIEFRWEKTAYKFQLVGFLFHIVYVIDLLWASDDIYIKGK